MKVIFKTCQQAQKNKINVYIILELPLLNFLDPEII